MLKLCVASIAGYVSYRPLLKTLKYDIFGTGSNFDEIRVFYREIFFPQKSFKHFHFRENRILDLQYFRGHSRP
jgi:hypothetical protein